MLVPTLEGGLQLERRSARQQRALGQHVTLTNHILAAVAEHDREAISERTPNWFDPLSPGASAPGFFNAAQALPRVPDDTSEAPRRAGRRRAGT
jgi:hypothetical protein